MSAKYTQPERNVSKEAKITIGDTELTEAQALAVRVAISGMLSELPDTEKCRELGDITEGYKARLSEVARIIIDASPK